MQKFLDLIKEERGRQDKLWGQQNHTLERWYTILGEEFGEVGKEICELGYAKDSEYHKGLEAYHHQQLRDELVQVAAVCVAILEAQERVYKQQLGQQQLQLPLPQGGSVSEET